MDYRLTNITTADRALDSVMCIDPNCRAMLNVDAEDAVGHAAGNPGHIVETTWRIRELLVVGQVNWASVMPPEHGLRQTEPGS